MAFRTKWSVYIHSFGVRNSEESIVLSDPIWIDLIPQDLVHVVFSGMPKLLLENRSTESTNWQFDESWIQVDLGKMGNQFIYKFQSKQTSHDCICLIEN